jgi:hypothetical protein
VAWPPRSPDLNPLYFYLWGHLKSLVYATPVNTQQELWQRVWVACDTVKTSTGVFERGRQSTVRRARACVEVEGSNFEHLLPNHYLDTS